MTAWTAEGNFHGRPFTPEQETERLRQQALLQQEQLDKQAAAMAKFEEEQVHIFLSWVFKHAVVAAYLDEFNGTSFRADYRHEAGLHCSAGHR